MNLDTVLTELPIVVIDFESTGVTTAARAVQVALARFEGGVVVGTADSLINPGMAIPFDATVIHGITDEMVASAPTLDAFFGNAGVRALLAGAVPAAYNAPYDRRFMPWPVLGGVLDAEHPWLDPLVWVKQLDKYVKGSGRHKLAAVCARHGVPLLDAHSAAGDARAAGELLHKLLPRFSSHASTLGMVLHRQAALSAVQAAEYASWRAKQEAVQP